MALIAADQITESECLEPSASPAWWGADSLRTRLWLVDGTQVIDRLMHPDSLAYSTPELLVEAAEQAGALGIGPKLLAADRISGETVTVECSGQWRTATIDDFIDPKRLKQLAQALGRVRSELKVKAPVATVFDDIRELGKLVAADDPALPSDYQWLVSATKSLEKWIPFDPTRAVFCHNSGDASNFLVGPQGLLLLDWDLARRVDPLQEIGIMMAEFAYLPLVEQQTFQILNGERGGERDYLIARAYGIAEHLRQALIGMWRGASEPGTIEYTKFADWHFLLLREELRDRRNDCYFASQESAA
jgi:hypothetical protein